MPLTELERRALSVILPLRVLSFETARARSRAQTGVGFFTDLHYDAEFGLDSTPTARGETRSGDPVGFVLFIRHGRAETLEGFTHGDAWLDDVILESIRSE